MPILLKKIEAEIISLFGDNSSDFTGQVYQLQSIVGKAGIEDYIELQNFIGLTQDFSKVSEGTFYATTPQQYGLGKCNIYEDLNLDKKN